MALALVPARLSCCLRDLRAPRWCHARRLRLAALEVATVPKTDGARVFALFLRRRFAVIDFAGGNVHDGLGELVGVMGAPSLRCLRSIFRSAALGLPPLERLEHGFLCITGHASRMAGFGDGFNSSQVRSESETGSARDSARGNNAALGTFRLWACGYVPATITTTL